MNIAILTAMPQEFRAVTSTLGAGTAERIGGFRAGRFCADGHAIVVVESGMGFHNAAQTAEAVIATERPDLLVSAGFCGGIVAELQVGDVIVANEFLIATSGGIDSVPVSISLLGGRFAGAHSEARVFEGAFVGTPTIMSKKLLAELLVPVCCPAVVEMESAAIAIVAAEHNLPLLAIRSVSDPADEELGFSLDEFCDAAMNIRPHRVFLTILRKPRIIPQLIRLAGNSRKAAATLATAFSRLLPLVLDAPGG